MNVDLIRSYESRIKSSAWKKKRRKKKDEEKREGKESESEVVCYLEVQSDFVMAMAILETRKKVDQSIEFRVDPEKENLTTGASDKSSRWIFEDPDVFGNIFSK